MIQEGKRKMLQFLCLAGPACLSMVIFLKGDKQERRLFQLVMLYGAFAMVDTALSLIFTALLGKAEYTCLQGNLNDTYISLKSMIFFIVISIAVGGAAKALDTYMDFNFKVKKESPKDEKEN